MEPAPTPSFFAAWMTGAASAGDIDDYIDAWHDAPGPFGPKLHEHLGLTWEQYKTWGDTGRLPERLAA